MIDGRATALEIRLWHMYAALDRAQKGVAAAAALRHPDFWYQKYGDYAQPPASCYIEAWDRLYAWKKEWLDYGEALRADLRFTAAVTTPKPKENGMVTSPRSYEGPGAVLSIDFEELWSRRACCAGSTARHARRDPLLLAFRP
jgi:hypothetical protein